MDIEVTDAKSSRLPNDMFITFEGCVGFGGSAGLGALKP